MKKRWVIGCCICAWAMVLTACGSNAQADSTKNMDSSAEIVYTEEQDTGTEKEIEEGDAGNIKAIIFSPKEVTVTERRFFAETVLLEMAAPEGARIYYTTDGSEPNTNAKEYTTPIELKEVQGSFPNCLLLKAKAYYSDGTRSEVITHTFWAHTDIETRFETILFSVSGRPEDLTNGPNAIFYEDNVKQRGKESEREVYIEAINSDGSLIFEQGAGVRPYGGASREASVKSMKLFARKEYDPKHGKFNIDIFGTMGENGQVMDKYDKLVLRNCGNDFQFAFIRDELNQRLLAQIGYTDCEAVVPAVVYLNGQYNGVYWLHENYCDDFFKDKYGDGEGKYEVLEGNEWYKQVDEEDKENAAAAREFNSSYNQLAYSDLTDEDNYAKLCAFMDVENYLRFYAYNIYINNNDWPQNNYKCYRYYAGEGERYGENRQDGRWRFLFHDMDYSMGLYEQEETAAGYNNLAHILDEEDERYSPLFANLMKREDCKEYFLEEIQHIMTGPLWERNVDLTLDNMNAERQQEMVYFFEYLEALKETDDTIWIWYEEYLKRIDVIKKFAEERKAYMLEFLKEEFKLSDI